MILKIAALVLSISFAPSAFAAISQKDAKKAIARMAGMSLPGSAVHINRINSSTNSTAEVSADLELAFSFEEESGRLWRIREIRVAQGAWEDLALFVEAARLSVSPSSCDRKGLDQRITAELNNRRARCLVADLFGVQMPSDAVRIKNVSVQVFALKRSALVVARVAADFRLKKDPKGWQVSELRTGSRDWLNVEGVPAAIDVVKRTRAAEQMSQIGAALDAYRRQWGNFVVTDKHEVLIDNLNPQFLLSVIRLDPWRNTYHYLGERDRFTLRSSGPDGKENTPDDLVVSH